MPSTSTPMFGPQRRTLRPAAIEQNARARFRRTLSRAQNIPGADESASETATTLPICYAHTYDDLLGLVLVFDGTSTNLERSVEHVYHDRFMAEWELNSDARCRHSYITIEDRNLVEARQARALAGLSTQDMDREIARRVQVDTKSWGWSEPIASYELTLTCRRMSRLAWALYG